jgi:hypothetical protein
MRFQAQRTIPKHLSDEEDEALYELALTPCASDAEFLEKLRYLYAKQAKIWYLPDNRNDYGCIAIAARMSLLSGERMTLRLRYLTLKLRALFWVFSVLWRLPAGAPFRGVMSSREKQAEPLLRGRLLTAAHRT